MIGPVLSCALRLMGFIISLVVVLEVGGFWVDFAWDFGALGLREGMGHIVEEYGNHML